ncbi:hypothetical protein BHE74_00051697 [Ensete ventricosum]|nr:hypothetical protein GW17_00012625 [Ensete ventricosum]RWW42716.1 hypothetical protein BHE74_00051697 [Ensete ventricosum]RZS15425.1 hypothetical protein BHM03_00047261 [Ensete ventricosum]
MGKSADHNGGIGRGKMGNNAGVKGTDGCNRRKNYGRGKKKGSKVGVLDVAAEQEGGSGKGPAIGGYARVSGKGWWRNGGWVAVVVGEEEGSNDSNEGCNGGDGEELRGRGGRGNRKRFEGNGYCRGGCGCGCD